MNYDTFCQCHKLSGSLLREWEEEGLIERDRSPLDKEHLSNEDVGYLNRILTLKNAGVEPDAIRELLNMEGKGRESVPRRLQILKDQRTKQLNQLRLNQLSVDRLDYLIGELKRD